LKVGQLCPLDSDFFNCGKNFQKAIKLQMWAGQLIKRKFNFQISEFKPNQIDQHVVLGSWKKSLSDG
jgi:hypothetical protein